MRRVISFSKRAVRHRGVRLALFVAVVIAASIGMWQGYAYLPKTPQTTGPKKQIATGVESAGAATVQPAAASLTDEQLHGAAGGGAHRLLGYGQPSTSAAQPPTSSYLPSSADSINSYDSSGPAVRRSGANGRQYGQYGQYGEISESATSPRAAQGAGEIVPDNPYRGGTGEGGATTTVAPAAPATTSHADLTPADATDAPAKGYGRGASVYGGQLYDTLITEPPVEPAATVGGANAVQAASVPPNPLPTTELGGTDYSSAAQGMKFLGASKAGGGLSSQRVNGPLPEGDGPGKMAAATPGERHLEGPQQPAITLQKVSPAEIQVGKQATFELHIRNAGQVPAHHVVVTDYVPAGTQLVDARPPANGGQHTAGGALIWSLGTLQPGEESQITLQVMPQSEGEIGSTAQVSFAAAATSRSICTRPQLTIEHTAPPKVLIGESLTVGITVSNPGSGPATGVAIEEDVPDGLAHVAGTQLEYEVGTLRPGESKRLELALRAEKPGVIQNTIVVRGEGGLAAQHTVQLEVVAPQLAVEVEGPKRRFLERQATYTLQVANPGTAPARDVELAAFLPRGMKFVTTDSQGQYDPAQHAVFWSLEELPPSKAGAVKLTTLPVEPGEQRLRIESRAERGLTAAGEQVVQVEQSAELLHTVKDTDEVIEVGSETTYEIRVTNTGTKAATNVRLAALMPPGMSAVGGEGPTRAGSDATQVIFEPLARLNPQEEVTYRVTVQGKQQGDHIVRVQLSSDEWPTPVTREESTRVYQDR
jgi:uncharacterized repeat protein (TIGR01451 family)